MSNQDQFITLVLAMREAQKAFFETKARSAMMEAVKYETRVDAWLQNFIADKVQLEMWNRSVKSSETPGAYNVSDEEQTKQGGAA